MGLGAHIKFEVHPPLKVSDHEPAVLLETIEKQISETITYE